VPDFSAAAAARLREVLPGWRPVGYFGDAIYAMRPWSRSRRAPCGCWSSTQAEFSRGLVA
jgi:hypothetical protein